MLDNYQDYINKMYKLKEEENKIKDEVNALFLSDIENELLSYKELELEVIPDIRELNWKQSDANSSVSCWRQKNIYWLKKGEIGILLEQFTYYDQVYFYTVHKNKDGKFTYGERTEISYDRRQNNDQLDINVKDFIRNYIKNIEKKVFKSDIKKYNL